MNPDLNLNIDDISDAVKIIDYASEQGAFKGWDNIRQILMVRDKLFNFVVSANATKEITEKNNDDS